MRYGKIRFENNGCAAALGRLSLSNDVKCGAKTMTAFRYNKGNRSRVRQTVIFQRLTGLVLAAGFSAIAGAGPSIEEVRLQGELFQGQGVTINGNGFGPGDRGVPVMWHRIDNAVQYDNVGHGDQAPLGGDYVWGQGRPSNPVMINREASAQRHQYSDANYESPGGNSFVGDAIVAGGNSAEASTDELYLSYWVKFDRDPYERANAASHKFVRVWGGGHDGFRTAWTGWTLLGGGVHAYSLPSANESVWEANRWHFHEHWVSTTEGRMRTYVDGKLRNDWHDTNPDTLMRDHSAGPRVSLLGFNPAHGEGYVREAKFYMDDIVINNSRARVVLSDSGEWSDSMHREYQPPSDWSDGSISIDLNYGSLKKEQALYLYVVNHEGEVNSEGVPLDCPECPEPTELRVE